MKPSLFFFDIETVTHPDAEKYIGIFTATEDDLTRTTLTEILKRVDQPTSGTKEVLIERANGYAGEMLQTEIDRITESRALNALSKAALDPDLGEIRAIGTRQGLDGDIMVRMVPSILPVIPDDQVWVKSKDFYFGNDEFRKRAHLIYYETEQDLIEHFWSLYLDEGMTHPLVSHQVGYNILDFDLPFLMRRSMDLGIKPNRGLDLRRYQDHPVTDLMQILFNWKPKAKAMKWVADRYGIANPNAGMSGGDVAEMDDTTLARYTAGDIYILSELYCKMDGVYWWPSRTSE